MYSDTKYVIFLIKDRDKEIGHREIIYFIKVYNIFLL